MKDRACSVDVASVTIEFEDILSRVNYCSRRRVLIGFRRIIRLAAARETNVEYSRMERTKPNSHPNIVIGTTADPDRRLQPHTHTPF